MLKLKTVCMYMLFHQYQDTLMGMGNTITMYILGVLLMIHSTSATIVAPSTTSAPSSLNPEVGVVTDSIINSHDFKYVFNNMQLCSVYPHQRIDLLIWVHSGPANIRRRIAMRETWANPNNIPSSFTTKLVFFLGAVGNTSKSDQSLQSKVKYEYEIYHDIVQEDYRDSYRNLTYKAISGLKWLKRYCSNVKLILKVDDDMIIATRKLLSHLEEVINYPELPLKNTILCDVWTNRLVERRKGMKWSISTNEYSRDHYPTYCPGLALLMSPDLVSKLYYNALRTPYFWVDDVFFTGFLTEPLNVTWIRMGAIFHYGGKLLPQQFTSEQTNYVFGHVFPYKTDLAYYLWNALNDGAM